MAETMPHTELMTLATIKTVTNRILVTQFGDAYRQQTKDGINSDIDIWNIEYAPLKGSKLITVETFLTNVGVTEWFNWIPKNEISIKKFTIDPNSIIRLPLNFTTFKIHFKITQSFTLG